jgi:hypothetical protein
MSLMLFGQAEPEPVPEETAPSHRRRYLLILGLVIALILAGGSAAYLILSSSVSVNRGPQGAPPGPLTETTTPAGDAGTGASATPGASPDASASHGASPGRSAGTTPGGNGGGPGAPGPVTYRVPSDELCPAVDFTAIHAKLGTGDPGSDHTDNPTSHYVDYICAGTFAGKVAVRIEAFIFTSSGDAAASYASEKRGDHVDGVGSDATGFAANDGKQFWLYATDGNLKIRIYQKVSDTSVSVATLRDVAISTAKATLPRLRG